MIFNLVALVVLGVAVAGTIFAIARTLGRSPPRWVLPVAAGVTMISFSVWNEYSWFSRTASALPDDVAVVGAHTSSTPLMPWTLVFPPVNRFAAIDPAGVRRNPEHPDLVMAEVILVTRFYPTGVSNQIYDCLNNRRAEVSGATRFDPDGRPQDLGWLSLDPGDAVLTHLCASTDAASG